MKVILYNAISIDGFIAKIDGDSDWVSEYDIPYFEEEMRKAGCIVIGRKTFEQFEGKIYPVNNIYNIVMTNSNISNSKYPNVLFTNASPKEIIQIAKEKGFESILLVGGGKMNGSFLKENLIDEIIVDIHPILLGEGIKMCETDNQFVNFKMESINRLQGDLILAKYTRA
jgi:dihydrofolate reductase